MLSEGGQAITEFILNPLWNKAGWNGTTFRWHPTSKRGKGVTTDFPFVADVPQVVR